MLVAVSISKCSKSKELLSSLVVELLLFVLGVVVVVVVVDVGDVCNNCWAPFPLTMLVVVDFVVGE